MVPGTGLKSFKPLVRYTKPRMLLKKWKTTNGNPLIRFAVMFWLLLFVLALIGPSITPYEYDEYTRGEDGSLVRNAPPSLEHPLGTTNRAYDVLSRLIYGVRPTVITGVIGGLMVVGIGTTIGVTAGYLGGWVENVLMRFTDFVYGVPIIPFAIVLMGILGIGFLTGLLVIGSLLWRGSARVLRSQVLQIKERPFILSAKAIGASPLHIIFKHILPNVLPMAVLFFALGIGYSILLQASLAFLGISDPFVPSWGIMLRNAYKSGYVGTSLWWSLPPGFLISLAVMTAFVFGRHVESTYNDSNDEAFAGAG